MKKLYPLLLISMLTACSTLTGGSTQSIAVQTVPDGANCLLSGETGSWTVEKTPATVEVPRAFKPLTVTCTQVGYLPVTTQLEARTRPRSYWNILLLGIPTLLDASSGAGYEYQPENVLLKFDSSTPAPQR